MKATKAVVAVLLALGLLTSASAALAERTSGEEVQAPRSHGGEEVQAP